MATRTEAFETLKAYFEEKGRVLTPQEYSRETDTPMRLQQVIGYFGDWKRLEKLLMATNDKPNPAAVTDIDSVLSANNAAVHEASEQWKQASENQDVKARREAEAQHVAEVLAANAATPEGANANKVAIGGKLAHEQQSFAAMGATVKVDPATGTQTVVDTDPDVISVANTEDPRTPAELVAKVAEEGVSGGSVPVDTTTASGSTGEASTDTVNALGAGAGADSKTETKAPTPAKK